MWVLGAGQCIYWGVPYYTFSVVFVPMREKFNVSDARYRESILGRLGYQSAARRSGRALIRSRTRCRNSSSRGQACRLHGDGVDDRPSTIAGAAAHV